MKTWTKFTRSFPLAVWLLSFAWFVGLLFRYLSLQSNSNKQIIKQLNEQQAEIEWQLQDQLVDNKLLSWQLTRLSWVISYINDELDKTYQEYNDKYVAWLSRADGMREQRRELDHKINVAIHGGEVVVTETFTQHLPHVQKLGYQKEFEPKQ